MPDPRLYESDTYVLLEPGESEQFLSTAEMLVKLEAILEQRQDDLPRDVQRFSTVSEQAKYVLESSCELDVAPGLYIQWYVVRLEK